MCMRRTGAPVPHYLETHAVEVFEILPFAIMESLAGARALS